jgi:hypothetical protein
LTGDTPRFFLHFLFFFSFSFFPLSLLLLCFWVEFAKKKKKKSHKSPILRSKRKREKKTPKNEKEYTTPLKPSKSLMKRHYTIWGALFCAIYWVSICMRPRQTALSEISPVEPPRQEDVPFAAATLQSSDETLMTL